MRIPRSIQALAGVGVIVASSLTVVSPAYAATTVTVNLAASTGALKYGATGFLYGLGDEGAPSDNMLAPLKLQVAAQKAPDGLQHPNGDALKVAPMWKRNGGADIQIYMQDIYGTWPYENNGLADYLAKIDTMTRKVVADPNRASYVYVPFNEPDLQWYGGNVSAICNDWHTIFNRIRSIDPGARIAGPGYAFYNSSSYRAFMTCTRNANTLPDVAVWHELTADFYTSWYSHYNDYRQIERDLGISARPISINEYGRIEDLGVPGQLVQFVSKFENSKVDGSLGYYTTASTLNDLVTQNNKATGGWWLYKWYGDMTGNTVGVTLPSLEGNLQAVASYDASKQQARVLFGGAATVGTIYDTNLVLTGLGATAFSGSAHVTVWGVDNSGKNPSNGPYKVYESDQTTSGGQFTVPLTGLIGSSAYYAIVTPNRDTTVASASRYEAEYQRLAGTARVHTGSTTGYSGTSFVEGYGGTNNAGTQFVVSAPENGYYNVALRYSAGPYGTAPANRALRLWFNGTAVQDVQLPATASWNTWNTVTTKLYLQAGINRIEYAAFTTDDADAANIDYIDVTGTTGTVWSGEAEAAGNTLTGSAARASNTAASGGQYVGSIGYGSANTLQVNNVSVPTTGRYSLVVQYANSELGPGAGSNPNIVERFASISANGGPSQQVTFGNTRSWSTYRTTIAFVNLNAGNNSITFSNSTNWAPDIDLVRVAATVGGAGATAGRIVGQQSGRCLEVNGSNTADGAVIDIWDCIGTANQAWTLNSDGTIVGQQSGKCLDVYNNNTADGATVDVWTCNGGTNQKWTQTAAGELVGQQSGKCLDVYALATANGSRVNLWTCNGGANQKWTLS